MAGRPAVNMINTLARIYDEIIRASQMLKSRDPVTDKVSAIVDWCANRMIAIDETYVAELRQSMPGAEFSPIDTLYQQATERLVKKAKQYRNSTVTVHDRAQESAELYAIAKMYQRAMNMLSTAFYKKAVIRAAKSVGVKRQPSPSDAVMWEHWIPKYRQRIAGMVANPNEKDIASYAGTLKDLTRHMTDSPRERSVVLEASKTMYRALRRAESGEVEDVQTLLRGVVSKLQSIE